MAQLKKMQINRFQLHLLVNDEEKEAFDYLADHGVFCSTCGEICPEGVLINKLYLNSFNDIVLEGNCKHCKGRVTRIMEFGEDRDFFNKACDFRKSIEN